MRATSNRGWFLLVIISTMAALLMGIMLVWLSIERTDMAYSIRQMRITFESRAALKSKLEVERERLLTPFELSRHAVRLAVREARVGQIRHLAEPVKTYKNLRRDSYASPK